MKRRPLSFLSLFYVPVLVTLGVSAQEVNSGPETSNQSTVKSGAYVEKFSYEDYLYSQSKKTEMGDQVELSTRIRYQFHPFVFGSIGFETIPEDNRDDNKTTKFEIRTGFNYEDFNAGIDLEIRTDSSTSSSTSTAISLGPDLDSKDTYISYDFSPSWKLSFFPFNFGGEVGTKFNTWDVTRIYFIEGTPNSINATPTGANEANIVEKTIPGFQMKWKHESSDSEFSAALSLGAATFLYPSSSTFDLASTSPDVSSANWERLEDFGYSLALDAKTKWSFSSFNIVGHTESAKTGSKIEAAASILDFRIFNQMFYEFEITATKNGSAPYRLDREKKWFKDVQTGQFRPVYRDNSGALHDWINETGFATSLKVGLISTGKKSSSAPYFLYRYQDKNFIFRDRESADILRTADESQSHGGLHRVGFGAWFFFDKFIVTPEFEYLQAENAVFANSSDVRDEKILSSYAKEDFLFYVKVSYEFDSSKNHISLLKR